MSTTKDLNQADPSNIEDSSSDSFFVSYWKNRNSSSIAAAASAKKVETSLRYDFISFLGVTQELELDYLPITWQPKLDNVGEGGTADIRQSLINLQTSFAYKRIKWSRQAQWNESRNFQALISEVMVLGNPLIRKHPNVIRLEGICWDFPPGDDNVWPVLVFEKAQNGDLGKFVNSDIGKCISLEDRLKLCADVADALKYIHSYRIIHGDVKPQNVLVFKDDSGGYVAKVADFGYSTVVANDGLIDMPKSKYWSAPEHHHRKFRLSDAMKMDVYSFGMLCMWLIFYNNTEYPDRNFQIDLESEDKLSPLVLAHQLIMTTTGLGDERQGYLDQVFNLTLCDPSGRCSDFDQLVHLLAPDRILLHHTQVFAEVELCSFHVDFKIAPSMDQLCQADYRVRCHIARCLKQRVSDSTNKPQCEDILRNAAFQLAFCYKVGFGVTKDDSESQIMLNRSLRQHEELEHEIDLLRYGVRNPFQRRNQGETIINLAQHYREHEQLESVEAQYRREIADMESVLGDTHFIPLNLKLTLSSILSDQGFWNEAEGLGVQVMEARKRVYGVEHPETLTSMAILARTYWNQGHWKKAEGLDVQVMQTDLRLYGASNPDTLSSMANLATTYMIQGNWKEAEELEIQVMEAFKGWLGVEHSETLKSMGRLASVYRYQGRWKEAEELDVQAAGVRKKVLGVDHPETLRSIGNLASTYRDQGRWKEAEELEIQVMKVMSRVLGAEHPDTLTNMNNLALTLGKQGQWNKAEELLLQVMETRKRTLGTQHPDTLASAHNLVATYRHQGRWKEAAELGTQVVEISKESLGPEHPSTLTNMGNLALTYRNQGRWEEAEELGVQVMEARRRMLGLEHPDTLNSMSNLASTYSKQGRWKKAEELSLQVIEASNKVRGDDHPDTLASITNLALIYGNQGRLAEAKELEAQVLETKKRVLGAEHLGTLTSMNNLATFCTQEQCGEAEELLVQVVQTRKRILGEEHPVTLISMSNLASIYCKQGRLKEAEELEAQVMETRKRILGPEHPDTLLSMQNLAHTRKLQDPDGEATDLINSN